MAAGPVRYARLELLQAKQKWNPSNKWQSCCRHSLESQLKTLELYNYSSVQSFGNQGCFRNASISPHSTTSVRQIIVAISLDSTFSFFFLLRKVAWSSAAWLSNLLVVSGFCSKLYHNAQLHLLLIWGLVVLSVLRYTDCLHQASWLHTCLLLITLVLLTSTPSLFWPGHPF